MENHQELGKLVNVRRDGSKIWTIFWRFILNGDRWFYLANIGKDRETFYWYKRTILTEWGYLDGWLRQIVDRPWDGLTYTYLHQRYRMGDRVFLVPSFWSQVIGEEHEGFTGIAKHEPDYYGGLPVLSMVLFIYRPKEWAKKIGWRVKGKLRGFTGKWRETKKRVRTYLNPESFDEIPF